MLVHMHFAYNALVSGCSVHAMQAEDRVLPVTMHTFCSPPEGSVPAADGGSNTGGAVLKQFFPSNQLQTLSEQIEPGVSSGSSPCLLKVQLCK